MNALLGLALLHLAALAIPGPDYLLVSRYAILKSRRHALAASLGIALGILAHVIICLTGLSLVIIKWPATLLAIKIIGAIYLFYLGISCLIQEIKKRRTSTTTQEKTEPLVGPPSGSLISACSAGFITNLFNPKAILFFVSLLTAFIPEEGLLQFGIFAAIQFFTLTLAWFAMVGCVLSRPGIQARAQRFQNTLEIGTGIAFMCLGVMILFTPLNP